MSMRRSAARPEALTLAALNGFYAYMYCMMISNALVDMPILGGALYMCGQVAMVFSNVCTPPLRNYYTPRVRIWTGILCGTILLVNLVLLVFYPIALEDPRVWILFGVILLLLLSKRLGHRLIRRCVVKIMPERSFILRYGLLQGICVLGAAGVLFPFLPPVTAWQMLGGFVLVSAMDVYGQLKDRAEQRALMEPVDSRQLDRTKEGEGAPEEYSYKSVTPQSEPTEELLSQEAWGETLSGYELKGVHSSIDRSAWEPLLSYLELRDLADDQEFAEKAPQLTDQEGALDVWIYLQAVLGIDNRGKNMYYVSKNRGASQKIYFAPWDMDITWGDALSEGTEGKIWDVGLNTALYSERINWSFGDRLIELDVEGSRAYVGERWKELRQGALSDESLTEAIEGLAAQVVDSGALARDQKRWPDSNSGQDYGLFTRMALYRMKLLDYYFDGNLEEYLGLGYQ